MIQYEDLLNIPYKKFGRDAAGYDCYGLVVECCKRNGTPLLTPDHEPSDMESLAEHVAEGLNIREIKTPKVGCIVETMANGSLHVGFLADRDLVIHAAAKRGVKTSSLTAILIADPETRFYEVLK